MNGVIFQTILSILDRHPTWRITFHRQQPSGVYDDAGIGIEFYVPARRHIPSDKSVGYLAVISAMDLNLSRFDRIKYELERAERVINERLSREKGTWDGI